MAKTVKPPKTPEDANELLKELGSIEGGIKKGAAAYDAEIAATTTKHAKLAEPMLQRRDEILKILKSYVEENRDELVMPNTKTIEFSHGTIRWLKGNAKVDFDTKDVPKILAFLRRKGKLRRFTRPQERKLVKDLMLQDRAFTATIPGVTITQKNHLVIKPKSSQLEVVAKGNPYRIPEDN